MPDVTLQIDLARRPGALLRVLALVERRGYSVVRVATEELLNQARDGRSSRAELVVSGHGPADRLARHLEGLLDVCAVHLPEPPRQEIPR